jgi:glycine/D-amino acid oxidase-like deaminating enzyme/nitrite reductase/ring-hydroxylating ferredoxin subunit
MARVEKSSGASDTPWLVPDIRRPFPSLDEDLEVDVAVIGGGISGLTTAYLLAMEGRKVALLEDGLIAGGETGRTTAHLSSALDDRFDHLIRLHGEEGARLAYQSHAAAIDQIEFTVRKNRIDCGFERLTGFLFVPPGETTDVLDQELEACRRIGFKGVEMRTGVQLDTFDLGPALAFPDQGQFHPVQYLKGLAEAIVRQGGRIFERSHVDDYELGDRIKIAVGNRGAVTASSMVVATNAPIVSRVAIPLRLYAYRTYAIAMQVPKGIVKRALYWDTADPYHYIRLQTMDADRDLVLVGGEDHKTGVPAGDDAEERYHRLESWARERIPLAGDLLFQWSGQIMEPADSLAFIGRYAKVGENVYIITGDSGHGMTHGTIGGMVVRDLIVGRRNPWTKIYDPARVTLKAIGEMAAENLGTLPQYGKWITGGDTASPRNIPKGEGAVIRRGLKKLAVYRDDQGVLHMMSAVCPHLGCIVAWNAAEKTWDCPCHGSRFAAGGRVLNGPANTDLAAEETAPPRPKRRAAERPRARKRSRK